MSAKRLAIDPLWQCLCPSWRTVRRAHAVLPPKRPAVHCLNTPPLARAITDIRRLRGGSRYSKLGRKDGKTQLVLNPLHNGPLPQARESKRRHPPPLPSESINYQEEPTMSLYNHMRGAAIEGKCNLCRFIATILVKERGEKPNIQIYNTLILSNISSWEGAAWRVADLLQDLEQDGLQADVGTCHAVLKVLSVHTDHLLRADVLDYMSKRWLQLTEDGAHDVAAGLFREGLFEQALQRLDIMRHEGMHLRPWLLDMAVYALCEANEVAEAHRIMLWRVDSNELHLSRNLWMFFLDKASETRHHPATSLAWTSQVTNHYINPSSGVCLNVLSTAAQAADAVMATEVFTQLSKRGSTFQPIHYEQLINTYLAADPPDMKRALSILTIMALEKIEPSISETRSLFNYLRDKPELTSTAYHILRDLHEEGRKIPIAALNLVIECHVAQSNITEAINLYKQIHTFVPLGEGAKKSFANVETFNLLLQGLRDPPNEALASFLVSELLALRITPTSITFDRLIIVFVLVAAEDGRRAAETQDAAARAAHESKRRELLDWAFRHFQDMQPLGWFPRFGTLEMLGTNLAKVGDARCWDVIQAAEDCRDDIDGWQSRGRHVRMNVEAAWNEANASKGVDGETSGGDIASVAASPFA